METCYNKGAKKGNFYGFGDLRCVLEDQTLRQLIATMVEKIKKKYKPEKILLFGSCAWGKPDRHSDVDLFIIKDTDRRHIDRSVEVAEILDEENGVVALDPLVYTPDEVAKRLRDGDPFIGMIMQKGVVLYG